TPPERSQAVRHDSPPRPCYTAESDCRAVGRVLSMNRNRVKQLYRAGKPSFGTYVTFPTAAMGEVAGLAGFGFVRLGPYHVACHPETLENMIRTAYAHDLTPWVRCRNDPWEIMAALDFGAQAISIPNVGSAEAARAAVAAAHYPPTGEREMSR